MTNYLVKVTKQTTEFVTLLIEGAVDEADAKACAEAGDGSVVEEDQSPEVVILSVDEVEQENPDG